MTKRMLIDATHREETRVVVVDGTKLDEFDFETTTKHRLKGNIYLAKVTRVEPSLQAAFVDYGGNRHGFLAFSEIHPDYYQIPVSDREALIKQQRQEAESAGNGEADTDESPNDIETVSGAEEDEIQIRPSPLQRYRIQEVIKRRQILLVQVTKEERGNKGAALTTYISLAGRYCVLMPNTTRGGGISRKIQSGEARKRLRSVVVSLDLPEGMAVILRTAGQERTKAEIRRDYDYLHKLWDHIRSTTLESTAPALIHEEANLIRRSIRDLYGAKIEEVLVEGDEGYRIAKNFMRTLMPSHAKRVQPYRENLPLFTRYQIDSQLDTMHSATVQLHSGGYIVIDATEALVAIDVNSGRATRERSIEETATVTNLEAAGDIARQLRLRDLAGLIVIDFIDMDENRNIRAVEKRLKEAVQSDRARIRMGRISSFGLLELSRQRLRPSLQEASSTVCAHCAGSGHVRSVESAALHALRVIEEEGVRGRASAISATMPSVIALYLANNKRSTLAQIEERYGMTVTIETDDSPAPPDCTVQTLDAKSEATPLVEPLPRADEEHAAEGVKRARGGHQRRRAEGASKKEPAAETPAKASETTTEADGGEEGEGGTRRRRRGRRGGRRRGRGRSSEGAASEAAETIEAADSVEAAPANTAAEKSAAVPETKADAGEAEIVKPKRRRRVRKKRAKAPEAAAEDKAAAEPEADTKAEGPAKPKPRRRKTVKPDGAGTNADQATSNGDNSPAPGPAAVTDEPSEPRRGWWQRVTGGA
ncbi:MAG: ribonuclease E/G [Alphaproteobacteria bacterium]|nr:ribonuclease E/G [Alphaproteobacteria bacterium]